MLRSVASTEGSLACYVQINWIVKLHLVKHIYFVHSLNKSYDCTKRVKRIF